MGSVNWWTVALLSVSNLIMLCAWYGPIRKLAHLPVWALVLISWGIALLEYCFAVPANRLGGRTMSLAQLKILQEAIALIVFVPFSVFIMREGVSWNYLCAALCILGAVYFVFRG